MSNTTQIELGSVVALWRYPVKSMMGDSRCALAAERPTVMRSMRPENPSPVLLARP